MRSITIVASLVIVIPLLAQEVAKPVKPPVPRTADGKPDMSGIWQGGGAGGLAFAIGSDNAKAARPGDAAVAVAPAAPQVSRARPPYQDWMLPKLKEIRDRRNIDDPSARCLLVGVPRITNMPLPIKIIQTPGEITFLYETFHAFRVIPTDGRKHPDDIDPSFMGDSVAHWEGDTLVVESVGFEPVPRGINFPYSEKMKIVERFKLADPETLSVDTRIVDPLALTQPYSMGNRIFKRHRGWTIAEYECEENNRNYVDESGKAGIRLANPTASPK